ncbi:MAG: hypothetical protein MJE68_04205, partial [Proteobacteria bacterium]|nr:hypothetical protein [Pseudomonadota bacterium]
MEKPRIMRSLECLEGQFLSSLGFCEPVDEMIFSTVPPGAVADLFSPAGPKFTVGLKDPERDPDYSLMVYYDPTGLMSPSDAEDSTAGHCPYIGLGAVLANPLLKCGDPMSTYMKLSQWIMDPKQRPTSPRAFLVSLHKAGETFVFPGSYDRTLVDPCEKHIRPEQALKSDPPAYKVEDLRFFQLHNVLVPEEGQEHVSEMVCFPRLNGGEARLVRSRKPIIAKDSKHHFDSCQA